MNKSELAAAIAKEFNASQAKATELIDFITDAIAEAVARDEAVTLNNFGVFEAKGRAARMARNIRTGEPVPVPAHPVPYFRPARTFRAKVSGQ